MADQVRSVRQQQGSDNRRRFDQPSRSYTREEIAAMTVDEYEAVEQDIMRALAHGRITRAHADRLRSAADRASVAKMEGVMRSNRTQQGTSDG